MKNPDNSANQGSVHETRESGEKPPKFFLFEGEPGKPSIAVALRDPGPKSSIMPVIEKLQERGYPMLLIISGWAVEEGNFDDVPEGFVLTENDTLSTFRPKVVIRTESDINREGEHALPEALEQEWDDALYVDFESYPGTSTRIIHGDRREPDYLLVLNEAVRESAVETREGVDADHIRATGNPAFDEYGRVGGEIKTEHTRECIEVKKEEFLVVFAGQLPPTATYALRRVVDALNALETEKEIVFMYAYHPRAREEDMKELESILHTFTNGRILERGRDPSAAEDGRAVVSELTDDGVIEHGKFLTDEVGYAADLLITTHSTEGIASMYRETPVLYVGIPDEGELSEKHYEMYPDGQKPLPVEVDAAFWIDGEHSLDEASEVLKTAIEEDETEREERKKKGKENFIADGKAAERVVEVIEEAIGLE